MPEGIGFVGVGKMGANMARRLAECGHRLTAVYDVDMAAARSLAAELNCAASETLAGITAASDVVITVVSDDAAMRGIFAADGDSLLKEARGRLFINCATVSPQIHIEIEARAAEAGAESIEACMASSITQAREGTLYLMCGGSPKAFARAKPVLKDLSASTRYIGPAGSAAKVKALVNMVMNINTAGLAEGLALGEALDLDLAMLREVFSETGANSRVLATDGEDMQNREHSCYFSAAHAAKDSGIALQLGEDAGLILPLAAATKRQYDLMVGEGLGALDKSGIAELTFGDPAIRFGGRSSMKIRRALISVSDKTGLVEFARELDQLGIELLSTGGTAALLRGEGIAVRDVSDFTGSPEIFDGRVKTLHPKVHGGLLFLRDNPDHVAQAKKHGIEPIDLVVVNLYPFAATVADPNVKLEEAIEQIDIGGPSMLRSAAKNYRFVTVVSDPADYGSVLETMRDNDGATTLQLRERLAIKVFVTTSTYDEAIANYLNRGQECGSSFSISLPLAARLRYGENPHQAGALYGNFDELFQKLHGKELSYNNILDISAASELIDEFSEPTVAILKHTNPCGVGTDPDLKLAWDKAFATDKQAPFGGIIICNRPISEALARAISEIFSEVIIAPEFEAEARALLQKKKNLRLMRRLKKDSSEAAQDIRSVYGGGLLVQDADRGALGEMEKKVVTTRPPTRDEMKAMFFGWKVVKHVKSNAIVFAAKDRTLGIGAGQMSRIDSTRIAIWKAKDAGLDLQGSAVASDAFFPFADGLIAAAEAGATAAVQPGGSQRDEEVIAAANERGVAMVFTGVRHFKH